MILNLLSDIQHTKSIWGILGMPLHWPLFNVHFFYKSQSLGKYLMKRFWAATDMLFFLPITEGISTSSRMVEILPAFNLIRQDEFIRLTNHCRCRPDSINQDCCVNWGQTAEGKDERTEKSVVRDRQVYRRTPGYSALTIIAFLCLFWNHLPFLSKSFILLSIKYYFLPFHADMNSGLSTLFHPSVLPHQLTLHWLCFNFLW